MKKMYTVIIIVLLILTRPIPTYAETGIYETAGELFAAYSIVDCNNPDASVGRNNEFPDSMCGYWVTDSCPDGYYNHYVIAIQDTKEGNELKQNILDLIKDDSTISFIYQKYSYNYLKQIQDEILPIFNLNGIVSTGIRQLDNHVEVFIHTEEKDNKKIQRMVEQLSQKYQDAICFSYTDSYFIEDLLHTSASEDNMLITKFMPYFFLLCVATIFLAFSFLIKLKERHLLVLQTTDKKTITVSNQLTTKEIEEMVKKSNIAVPQVLDNRIMDTINKND